MLLPGNNGRANPICSSAFERDYLQRVLRLCRGRVGDAARRSGVNERTLYAMMRRHGLRKEDFRRSSG
jgi:DNA-binding NtrC family response regulator